MWLGENGSGIKKTAVGKSQKDVIEKREVRYHEEGL